MAKTKRRATGGRGYVLLDQAQARRLAIQVADLQTAVCSLTNLVRELQAAQDGYRSLAQGAQALVEPLGNLLDQIDGENMRRREAAARAHRTRARRQTIQADGPDTEEDRYDLAEGIVQVTGPMQLPGPTINLAGETEGGPTHD